MDWEDFKIQRNRASLWGEEMRVFKKPNLSNDWKCPICGTSDKKEVVLIGIIGTEEGRNIQAEQFHLDCLDLAWNKHSNIVYQIVEGK